MSKKPKVRPFFLHYVGQNLYKVESFEREGKRYGVQRTVSFANLHKLSFGVPILLARYISPTKEQIEKQKLKSPFHGGTAEIFGYFTLDGLTHNLPQDAFEELSRQLDIVKIDNTPFSVSRACGSYSVGGITYIKNTLEEVIQKIHQLNIPVNSFKWFIKGKYYTLTPFILSPATFSRGIQTVEIGGLNLTLQKTETASLVWLYNYRQRRYMPKAMRERFFNSSQTEFIDRFFEKEGGE